jgi:hypothetical protein
MQKLVNNIFFKIISSEFFLILVKRFSCITKNNYNTNFKWT